MTQSEATQRSSGQAAGKDAIRPFHVSIPEEARVDLRRRIAATRWPEKETVADRPGPRAYRSRLGSADEAPSALRCGAPPDNRRVSSSTPWRTPDIPFDYASSGQLDHLVAYRPGAIKRDSPGRL